LVPGLPQILRAPERSPGWQELHAAYGTLRDDIAASGAEVILYFSTQWFSVLGTMIQGRSRLRGTHVDGNWHQLGSLSYDFTIDTALAQACSYEISCLGVTTKLIDYDNFPLDTGTIVAQSLLNPGGRLPACIVSCNIYADETEVFTLGQACRRALEKSGKKVAVVLVSSLSHRFHTKPIDPREDFISSASDDEWNQRILGLLEHGKLDEVVSLAGSFAREASADLGFKGACWLSGVCGFGGVAAGTVYRYHPVMGAGAAVCRFALNSAQGNTSERDVLGMAEGFAAQVMTEDAARNLTMTDDRVPTTLVMDATKVPAPVGAYPHGKRVGNLLFLSGIGPRLPAGAGIAGVEWDSEGRVAAYDISLQTRQVFANVEAILAGFGCSLEAVVDVQVFLTDMARDFADFNRVYGEYFDYSTGPCRTTVEVPALPTPIAVEFKVIAAIA
jgi:2-aminophenol/2-amino-5-chlorophenol 1,6-dioxygenase alpha subunit